MTCSVLIIAKNESKHIKDCIESCQSFADEVIVVDDFSTDDTKALAEGAGAKVVQRALNGDWGAQRTFSVQQASCDWIFMIDADERVTPELGQEIKRIVTTQDYKAYEVPRLNFFNRKLVRHGVFSAETILRLMPREGATIVGVVHEKIDSPAPKAYCKGALLHYTYDSWAQYEAKMNKYSTLSAKKYFEQGKKSKPVKDLVLRPLFAFIKTYFIKLGFLDGTMGFALSLNYASYTLAKYFKLQELWQQKQAEDKAQSNKQ